MIPLPIADTGDCSDGVTVTLNGLLDVPSSSSNDIFTTCTASELAYCFCTNLTLIPKLLQEINGL